MPSFIRSRFHISNEICVVLADTSWIPQFFCILILTNWYSNVHRCERLFEQQTALIHLNSLKMAGKTNKIVWIKMFSRLHVDVFRIITKSLTLFEYLSLSGTDSSARQLSILDLEYVLGKQTLSTFGLSLLRSSTCDECKLVSWAVLKGQCPHTWQCINCYRRGPNYQFVLIISNVIRWTL